jgi:[ribosomal protein S5]-alanine N-acetyltransferase
MRARRGRLTPCGRSAPLPAVRYRVVAHRDPRNTRSWVLLERLGFRREAHLRSAASFAADDAGRPVWHDAFGYGLLSDEWERAAVG